MGREIRRVPVGWEHSRQQCEHSPWAGGCNEAKLHGGQCYQPLYDRDFETEAIEWLAKNAAWEEGTDTDRTEEEAKHGRRMFYWEWAEEPPNREYYHPKWTDEECTAYQMYETVSEGTPTSPVFETKEGLIDYLVNHGDFWDQYEGSDKGWSREHAEAFVEQEWAPSMVVSIEAGGHVEIKMPRDAA